MRAHLARGSSTTSTTLKLTYDDDMHTTAAKGIQFWNSTFDNSLDHHNAGSAISSNLMLTYTKGIKFCNSTFANSLGYHNAGSAISTNLMLTYTDVRLHGHQGARPDRE